MLLNLLPMAMGAVHVGADSSLQAPDTATPGEQVHSNNGACIDCNIQKRIRCLLCMNCYNCRVQRLQREDIAIHAYNLAGEEVRPTGVTMKSYKEAALYLEMPYWQVWRDDRWCVWEERPRSAMPLALCGGMSVSLAPHDALGLFGPVHLLRQSEVCESEIVERDCADVSDLSTPPTPPPVLR